SPVPLNEEQRKILDALRHIECRFLAVEGPPGCGKSHTIVAIAFEAILTGKNVLVLSDKKEALDVVEDKLTKVLNSVRTDGDFQNPILRLGKAGNTYGKILNAQALDAIRTHHRVAGGRVRELHREIASEEKALKSQINKTVEKGEAIDIREVAKLGRREAGFAHVRALERILSDDNQLTIIEDAWALARWCAGEGAPLLKLLRTTTAKSSLTELAKVLRMQKTLAGIPSIHSRDLAAIRFFTGFAPHHNDLLQGFVRRYHAAKKPVIGFFLTRTRARAIDEELGQHMPCRSALEAHRKVRVLVRAASVFTGLYADFNKQGLAEDHQHFAY